MKLKQFIDNNILSKLYPEEKILLNIGYKQNIPYGTNFNSAEVPDDSRFLAKHYNALLDGKIKDGVYFCTTTQLVQWYENTEDRPNDAWHGVYRNKRLARRWLCFVADDVHTKINIQNLRGVEPTFIVETSMGNYQYVYVFDMPVDNLNLAKAFLVQAEALKLTDAGGLSTTKLVRLPTGINNKEQYIPQNRLWNGEKFWTVTAKMVSGQRYNIFELAKAFGMDVHALSLCQQANVGYASSNVVSMVPNKLTDATRRLQAEQAARNEWGVKVLSELLDNNMIKTPRDQIETCRHNADGFISIVCPWEEEHTTPFEDNDGGTQFSPVGFGDPPYDTSNQFICRHGHCRDKKTLDLKIWALKQGWITDEDLRDKSNKGFEEMLERALATKIQLTTGSGVNIMDLEHPQWKPTNPTSLQLEWAPWSKPIGEKKTLSLYHAWARHPWRKTAAYWEYCPGRDPLIVHDDGFFILNKWMATGLMPKPCSHEMRKALNAHFKCITGNQFECRLAKAFIASCIVHPEIRLMVAWLTICEQEGCGRGTLSSIVRALSGPGNGKNVAAGTILRSDFTAWVLNATFIHCPEFLVFQPKSHDQRSINDRIKQMVSESQLEINEKYGGTDQQIIRAMLMLASNYRDALSLSEGDRRFIVTMSDTPALSAEHYAYLNRPIVENNTALLEEMLGYFHELDAIDGNWIRNMHWAPMTEGKEALIEATRNEVDDAVATILNSTEDMPWLSPVLDVTIRKILSKMEGTRPYLELPKNKLMLLARKELNEHGYKAIAGTRRKYVGRRQRVSTWIRENDPDHELMTGKAAFKANVDAVEQFWGEREHKEFDRIRGLFGAEMANELWS